MDQSEVARYRALLREQSQAKSARLRPLSRWLGGDRTRSVEPVREESAAPTASEVGDPAAGPSISTLDGPPTFPPRRPLPPLDPALSSAFEAHAAHLRERSATPVAPEAAIAPEIPVGDAATVTTNDEARAPEIVADAPLQPSSEILIPTELQQLSEPPVALERIADFVDSPPLGILDLLSPAMIAEFDLERPNGPGPSRAFGRRDGEATPDLPAPPAISPAQTAAPLPAKSDSAPEPDDDAPVLAVEGVEALEPEPAVDAAGEAYVASASIDHAIAQAEAAPAETEVLEEEAATADFRPEPTAGADERQVDAVAAISGKPRARPPLLRRLEPERTSAAVMRNLQTILEAEQSIVELWRSMARVAA